MVPQNAGTEIFEPGDMFRDHVEFDDVIAGIVRGAKNEIEFSAFSRFQIAGGNRAAGVPLHFFSIRTEQMGAEADNTFRLWRADRRPARDARVRRSHLEADAFARL